MEPTQNHASKTKQEPELSGDQPRLSVESFYPDLAGRLPILKNAGGAQCPVLRPNVATALRKLLHRP